MIRIVRLVTVALASLVVVAIGSPLLFWLGRTKSVDGDVS